MGPFGPERHPAAPRSASWRPRRFRPPRTTLLRPHQLHSGGHGDTVSRETPAAQGERRLVSGVRGDATYRSRAHPSYDRSRPRESRAPPRIDLGLSVAMKRPRAAPRQPGAPPRASRRAFVSRAAYACRREPRRKGTSDASPRGRRFRIRRRDPAATAPPASTLPGPRHRPQWGLTWTKPSRFPQRCLRAPLPRLHRLGRPPGGDERRLGLGPGSPARRGVIVIPWFHPAPTRRRAAAVGSVRRRRGAGATGVVAASGVLACARNRLPGVPQRPRRNARSASRWHPCRVVAVPVSAQRDRGFRHLPAVGPIWAPASVVPRPEPARPRRGGGAVRLGRSLARNYPLKPKRG